MALLSSEITSILFKYYAMYKSKNWRFKPMTTTFEEDSHNTVCSFIIPLRRSQYYCCKWIWLTKLTYAQTLILIRNADVKLVFYFFSFCIFLTRWRVRHKTFNIPWEDIWISDAWMFNTVTLFHCASFQSPGRCFPRRCCYVYHWTSWLSLRIVNSSRKICSLACTSYFS